MIPSSVAFLGPEGTFTSEAARIVAPLAERVPLPTITAVLESVRSSSVPFGVVPIENAIEGSVNVTLDELAFGAAGAFIRGEVTLPIELGLLLHPGADLADLAEVRSMPVALAQCRTWLQRHLPDVAVEASTSTAEAAREAAEADGSVAAVGTRLAAERFGLQVRVEDIADHPGNATRFVVLGATMHPPTGADKTSLVVFFGEDRPGLLLRILEDFALRGVNLTKIESRPTKQQLGEYCILIDCAAHVTDARLAEALRSVHRHVADVRILGSYPRADGLREHPAAAETDAAYAEAVDWYRQVRAHVDDPPEVAP